MDEAELSALCARWPGTRAQIKWQDDLVFSVADKMFCVYCLRGAQAGHLSFKAGAERFLELSDRPGLRPAPYLARAHWVQMTDPTALGRSELEALLRASYDQIVARLTRAQRQGLGVAKA